MLTNLKIYVTSVKYLTSKSYTQGYLTFLLPFLTLIFIIDEFYGVVPLLCPKLNGKPEVCTTSEFELQEDSDFITIEDHQV